MDNRIAIEKQRNLTSGDENVLRQKKSRSRDSTARCPRLRHVPTVGKGDGSENATRREGSGTIVRNEGCVVLLMDGLGRRSDQCRAKQGMNVSLTAQMSKLPGVVLDRAVSHPSKLPLQYSTKPKSHVELFVLYIVSQQ